MKNLYTFLAMTMLGAAAISNANAQTEITVTNGGFESGVVDGWAFDNNDGAALSWEEETDDVQEGSKALHLYCDGLGTEDWSQQFKNETFAVEGGKSYRYSVWVKDVSNRENGDTCKLSYTSGMTNAVDTWTEDKRLDHKNAATEWEEWRISLQPSSDQLSAGLFAYMSTHVRSTGECIVDNFTVWETQVLQSVIDEGGATVTVQFIPEVGDPAGNEASFDVQVNGSSNAVTAIALNEDDATMVTLTLTTAVAATDEVVITYTPGTLATAGGEEVAAFTETINGSSNGGSAIKHVLNAEQNVFPNPASGIVYISNIADVNEVKFIDATGRVVKTVSGTSISNVNISEMNTGLYFMLINTTKGEVFSNRLVIN